MITTSLLTNRLLTSAFLTAILIALPVAGVRAQTPEIVNQTTDLTYISSDLFTWDLNANSETQGDPAVYDQVVAERTKHRLTAAGAFSVILGSGVDLQDSFWNINRSWEVFSKFNPGKSSGSFTTLNQPSGLASARPGASFSIGPVTSGAVTLSYTAATFVPEPTSALAGLLLAAGLLRRKRQP